MESIIQTFQINWKILLAQVVNFIIVALVLWFFVVKPLIRVMSERTKRIEKGLKDAEKISQGLKLAEQEKASMITSARKESHKIIEEAKIAAEKEREKILQTTKQQAKTAFDNVKKEIAQEKHKVVQEAKGEIASLVFLAASRVLEKVVDAKVDQKFVSAALKDFEDTQKA